MKMKKLCYCLGGIALSIAVAACSNEAQKDASNAPAGQDKAVAETPATAPAASSSRSGKVVEVMDASGYTYLGIDNGTGATLWAAIPKTELAVGEEVTLQGGSVMKDFSSKTLNRTFDEIIFASGVVRGGSDQVVSGDSFAAALQGEGGGAAGMSGGSNGAVVVPSSEVKVEKATGENAKTVGEVFSQAAELDKQKIVVRGQVVKVSKNIMGKNWLHIQDGTGDSASSTHDLVVTTDGGAEKGEVVTVEGLVAANKDFGAGYKYAVILEEAVITQ
jgi:hypothetical protein